MFDTLRGLLKLRALEKEAMKMNDQATPGWRTSEFWLTVLAQVPTVLGLFLGATNPITIGIGAASIIAYTIARSTHKSAVSTAAASAALQAAAKAAQEAEAAAPSVAASTQTVTVNK